MPTQCHGCLPGAHTDVGASGAGSVVAEMDVRFILSDDFGTVSMPVPTEMRGDYTTIPSKVPNLYLLSLHTTYFDQNNLSISRQKY